MATFTFNAEHFDTLADCMWDGSIARLSKPNKTILEIHQGSMAEGNDDHFSITIMTPGGIELHANEVFSYGELFDFLDGLVFEDMDFIER